MSYSNILIPEGGEVISIHNGKLQVPSNPIIPFIEGDGTGPDIWRASKRVFDAAVSKAYLGDRVIHWMEVFAGAKSFHKFGNWLPDETITAFSQFLVGIKPIRWWLSVEQAEATCWSPSRCTPGNAERSSPSFATV